MTTRFRIDQENFSAEETFIEMNEFTIQSIPKNYTVSWLINNDPFEAIILLLKQNEKNLLLIDEKLLDLYQPDLAFATGRIFRAKATEDFKSLNCVTEVIDFLQKHEFTKGEKFIVVGGGIIQDTAGFVSAIYKRGISWVLFPTTLLAMCDSCIGGKAGINYKGVKNQLGLFSSPTQVCIHPAFLKTLTPSEIHSGLGEILKLCITGGQFFVDLYKKEVVKDYVHSFSSFKPLIMAALSIKKAVIEKDEFEHHHRKALNYGHTIGHAIESLSKYQIPHGQAVVIGMIIVNEMSHTLGLLSKKQLQLLNELCFNLINKNVLKCLKTIKLETIISVIQRDKKTVNNHTHFVLLKSIGNLVFAKLELDQGLYNQINTAFQKLIQNV